MRQLRHKELDTFAAIMRTGSVVAAAVQLCVSQPSVSRMLHDLEAELGYELFRKRGRGLAPTAAAHALYAEVERSFLGLGRISAVARQLQAGVEGAITLGCNYAASFDFVHAALGEMRMKMPNLSVSLRVQTSSTLMDWARTGFVDLAIVNLFDNFPDLDIIAERELDCVCVLPVGHPLLEIDRPIGLHELKNESLILPDEVTLASIIPDPDLRTQIVDRGWLDAQIWYPVAAAVEHGLGVGIADPLSAGFFARTGGIAVRPIAPRLPYRVAIVRHRGAAPSNSSSALSEILCDHLSKL